MNKEEFIGKLEMVYVGDRNAFNEIVEDNQRLKNEVVYSKVEIDRLNNILDKLEKWLKDKEDLPCGCGITVDYLYAYENCLDKLKSLKENR